jgi:hypothetical protein
VDLRVTSNQITAVLDIEKASSADDDEDEQKLSNGQMRHVFNFLRNTLWCYDHGFIGLLRNLNGFCISGILSSCLRFCQGALVSAHSNKI